MPEPYTIFRGQLYSNYTIAIAITTLAAGLIVYSRLRNEEVLSARSVLNLYIVMLIAALIVGRLLYVFTHGDYYGSHLQEVLRLDQGGIDWHGVVWGSSLVLWGFARWKQLPMTTLLNAFAPALPILMFGAWWGCHAASCSYGAEIQNMSRYPSWLVWEGPDIYGLRVPRFYTQSIGTLLAFAFFLIDWLLARIPTLRWNHFGIMVALLSLAMFGIGFMRGDDVVRLAALRLDQWLDVVMLLFALFLIQRTYGTAAKKGYDFPKQTLSLESD